MRNFISIALLLVLMALFFYLRQQNKRPAKAEHSSQKVEKKPLTVKRPASKKKVAKNPVTQNAAVSFLSHKKKGLGKDELPFENKKGWAVMQGDILLGKLPKGFKEKRGKARLDKKPTFWDQWEIPYVIDSKLPRSSRVLEALALFHEYSDFRFIPYEAGDKDGLVFTTAPEHCYSFLGKVGGMQPIRLSSSCGPQEIAHEIMHALGFMHEQSREDRDRYVDVLWDNIDPKYHLQFSILPSFYQQKVRDFPFDFESIMLYRDHLFVKEPGLKSLRSRTDQEIRPTQAGLSEGDREKLRLYFY